MQKDMTSIWKQWNSKFKVKNRSSCVDGLYEKSIANECASPFTNNCTPILKYEILNLNVTLINCFKTM